MTKEQIHEFKKTINTFKECNLLNYIVIIGSWAVYLYKYYFNNADYKSGIKTRDIDILYPNINKPKLKDKIDIKKKLLDIGYVTDVDKTTEVTRFYKDGEIELEFLVQEKGSGDQKSYTIDPISIRAEGLRHLDVLIDNLIIVKIEEDIEIRIPHPAAMIWHKLIINHSRRDNYKKEKDLRTIDTLLSYLMNNEIDKMKIKSIYAQLNKKEKNMQLKQ